MAKELLKRKNNYKSLIINTMATKTTKKMAPTKGPMKMKEDKAMMPAYKKGGSMGKKKC